MKTLLASVGMVLFLSGCPHLPPPSGCAPSTSSCIEDRPYVCSGSQRWTPVGDTTCTSVGAVCCWTAEGIHACVPADACVAEVAR